MAESGSALGRDGAWTPPVSLDEARALARERFKSRLKAGERIGECGCGEDDPVYGPRDDAPPECVVGVRFRDSGRVYYFRPQDENLIVDDWIVVTTGRGFEAARVVIAPHQVQRALLQGEIGTVVRRLNDDDAERLAAQRAWAADTIKRFGELARSRQLGAKPISADYAFDGSAVTVSYSVPDRDRTPDAAALRDLARDLAGDLSCRVELKQVGPRDEARLLGGLGRCGRTLCCSSWLPVFPEISMSMAKNQELPLNPAKVSGVCGRLLCCLSYENDQYRQMKAVMPKLGAAIDTPAGVGQVVSMHLLKELVTVRLDDDSTEVTFRCDELDLGAGRGQPTQRAPAANLVVAAAGDDGIDATAQPEADGPTSEPTRKRRRRRGGRRAPGPGSGGE